MTGYSDKVPIPPKDTINTGLSAARESTMLATLGSPGKLSKDCSEPADSLRKRLVSKSVGLLRVEGLDFAVESLVQLFAEVQQQQPDLFQQVKTAGVLCVRHRRTNPARFSNHSWGTAIDIYFGPAVLPQGTALTHRGNLMLAPYFNRHGWYWGAEFSGDSVDSMHFELAEETILKIGRKSEQEVAPLLADATSHP